MFAIADICLLSLGSQAGYLHADTHRRNSMEEEVQERV
jgi:hypothetical protein